MIDVFPEQYSNLLSTKKQQLESLFSGHVIPDLEVFDSPSSHFRMRSEFRIWHDGRELSYVMFKAGDNSQTIKLDTFPRASKHISELMRPLLMAIREQETLARRLYQIEFLGSTQNEMLVSLIYHKKLDETWETAATLLQQQFDIKIIGRSKKQKIILDADHVIEKMTVGDRDFHYQQIENSFTQPNAAICQKMLNWVKKNAGENSDDLLELYCGNGNFTLPLSYCFNKVLATEVSKTSVKSAIFNINLNKIKNVEIVRLSSEEITQALQGVRSFRRLADIDLNNYQFNTVLVDPPRSGLDDATLALISQFSTIIYISCNPQSLLKNMEKLPDFNIKNFALFDQFPYTDHIECGVILKKNK